jgi:uncharacterized protein (TIGR02231 family)
MTRSITFFAIIFLFVSDLAAQNEINIGTEIKHVTVFPDRAQIDRETSISVPAGKSIFKLTGLSPYIDMQSIQIKGFGEFVILAVNQQNNYLQNLEETQEVKNLRREIEALRLKVEDEKAAINILKEKADFLRANQAILVKTTSFSLEQFKSVIDLYTSNMSQITTGTLKKERLIKEYEKKITALQQQLSDKLGKQKLPSGEISVTIQATKQVSGRLTCSYVVTNAGWYPSYDIRVVDINDPVSIIYKANVFQNTGIVWKNVKLSFSNATPWISGNIPVLHPWFIDYYNPSPVRIRGVATSSKSAAPVMMEMAAEENRMVNKALPSAPVPVSKRVGETTITFNVSIPYTIQPNGKTQTVEIQKNNAPAQYTYVTIPKLSSRAYLTANISDWAKLSLQSGDATLYFENSYVGKSSLDVNQLKDTLTISLGNDNSILVKREKRKEYTSKKTIGSNKTETFSFLLTIRNNKTNPVSMTVNDQIPVSTNSGIDVDPIELSGGRLDNQTGKIKWDLKIKPGETKQIVLTYSVKYPKDKKIILE